jgi:hypothetical protein
MDGTDALTAPQNKDMEGHQDQDQDLKLPGTLASGEATA